MIKEKLKLIIDLVRNEYSFPSTKKEKIGNALSWGIKVFLVLFLLRPFGISDESKFLFFYTCVGFGLITFFVFVLNNFTIKILIYRKLNKKWYVRHELLNILLLIPLISILNYLFYTKLDSESSFLINKLLKISFYTINIIFILFFLNVIYYLSENFKKELIIIQTKLEYFVEINMFNKIYNDETNKITLNFDNEKINLQKDAIVYVCAWGNYIKIYVLANNEIIQIIKRGKFKETVGELSKYTEFYQCHRSYIINLRFTKLMIGNSKKPLLVLTNNVKIPVSREKSKPLKEIISKIQNHKHSVSSL